MKRKLNAHGRRRGVLAILLCFLLLPLLAIGAMALDYGFLLYVRNDLQRIADQAVLAAVPELEPDSNGTQDFDKVRAKVREYVELNAGDGFVVLDEDIEIGRYDPQTIYSDLTLLNNGIFDTVRIKVRRSDLANSSVSLIFARTFGKNDADVSATAAAVMQKARSLSPGADILPMSIPLDVWNAQAQAESWSIYGSGRIEDQYGSEIPGNWGTLDIGHQSNSTSDLADQILNGLRQEDLDAMYNNGSISENAQIDSQEEMWLNGDTGLSSGLRHSIEDQHGAKKLIPIFDQHTGQGGNLEFHVVAWGVIRIVDSHWQGSQHTNVTIEKSFTYDSDLRPQSDLSNTTEIIQAAYTAPVLVQ